MERQLFCTRMAPRLKSLPNPAPLVRREFQEHRDIYQAQSLQVDDASRMLYSVSLPRAIERRSSLIVPDLSFGPSVR